MRFKISSSSWFKGLCNDCGYNIIVTQPKYKDYYYYYCSNKYCKNHKGKELYDTDGFPNFVTLEEVE